VNVVIQKSLMFGFILVTAGFSCVFAAQAKPLVPIKYCMESVSDVVNLFDCDEATIRLRVEETIADAQKKCDSILSIATEVRTFENTVKAYDRLFAALEMCEGVFCSLEMLSPKEDIRKASKEAILKLHDFAVDLSLNIDLYKAFISYVEGNKKNEELNAEQTYYIKMSIDGFRRQGLHLSEDVLSEVRLVSKELGKLDVEFCSNISEDDSSFAVAREALIGLEESFIDGLEKTDDGGYILTCDYPTFFNVMKHCSVEETRKKLYRLFQCRAYPQNKEILQKKITESDKLAQLLNFDSFAHLNIASQMAKDPETAEQFIRDLVEKVSVKEKKEFELLSNNLTEGVELQDGRLNPWDIGYIKEVYKKKHFDIDDRVITEYFPVEKTIEGIFSIYQDFLGLRFSVSEEKGLWADGLSVIEVRGKGDNLLKGYIVLDLYPRANKYSHACHMGVIPSLIDKEGNRVQPSVSLVIANFPKSTNDCPSLLTHNDVTTFFHEFGHAMHSLLGATEMDSFSGTRTTRDFVEIPSQMFEEWMWDKEILKKVSSYYQTGEPLSDDMIEKLVGLKNFTTGFFVRGQCQLAMIALNCFKPGAEKDPDAIAEKLHKEMCTYVMFDDSTHYTSSFVHLVHYAAKYYCYMWSKVLALDVFDEVKKHGLLNPEIGKRLVDKVLGKGGSVDPQKLLVDFLGREPNQDAFLRDIGL
jgi:thimet oligopeptidase